MSDNPAARKGSFIPFPVPLPVTAAPTPINDPPLDYLCFNRDWTPYVMGALKALARDETYQGAEADRKAWVVEARSLIINLCDCLTCQEPDWEVCDTAVHAGTYSQRYTVCDAFGPQPMKVNGFRFYTATNYPANEIEVLAPVVNNCSSMTTVTAKFDYLLAYYGLGFTPSLVEVIDDTGTPQDITAGFANGDDMVAVSGLTDLQGFNMNVTAPLLVIFYQAEISHL